MHFKVFPRTRGRLAPHKRVARASGHPLQGLFLTMRATGSASICKILKCLGILFKVFS